MPDQAGSGPVSHGSQAQTAGASSTATTPTTAESIFSRFRLDGRVVLINGVGPTSGRNIALALAEAGADVCLVARKPTVIEETAGKIEALGRRALPLQADMNDSAQVDTVVERARRELGGIDVLCNHGGSGRGAYYAGPFTDIDDQSWEQMLRQVLSSVFYATRAVARVMVQQGRGGSIINTSSLSSVMTPTPPSAYATTPYAAAKAGVNRFTQSAAQHLGSHGIRVNAIVLGVIRSPDPEVVAARYANNAAGSNISSEAEEWLIRETPLGRYGSSDEVPPAVLYLASDASSFVTGMLLFVSGGLEL